MIVEISDALKEHAAVMRYLHGSTLCKDVPGFSAVEDAKILLFSLSFRRDIKEIWFGFRSGELAEKQFAEIREILNGLNFTEDPYIDAAAKTAIYHWQFHR